MDAISRDVHAGPQPALSTETARRLSGELVISTHPSPDRTSGTVAIKLSLIILHLTEPAGTVAIKLSLVILHPTELAGTVAIKLSLINFIPLVNSPRAGINCYDNTHSWQVWPLPEYDPT